MADEPSLNRLTISAGPAGDDYAPSKDKSMLDGEKFASGYRYHVESLGSDHSFVVKTPDGASLAFFLDSTLDEAIGRFVRTRGGAGCFNLDALK